MYTRFAYNVVWCTTEATEVLTRRASAQPYIPAAPRAARPAEAAAGSYPRTWWGCTHTRARKVEKRYAGGSHGDLSRSDTYILRGNRLQCRSTTDIYRDYPPKRLLIKHVWALPLTAMLIDSATCIFRFFVFLFFFLARGRDKATVGRAFVGRTS